MVSTVEVLELCSGDPKRLIPSEIAKERRIRKKRSKRDLSENGKEKA